MDDDAYYNELAERAERGELQPIPGTAKYGEESRDEARRMLMDATGTTNLEDMMRVALGRPRVGAPQGGSPLIRARVPQTIKDSVVAIAKRDNRKESEIIREALAAYVIKHAR